MGVFKKNGAFWIDYYANGQRKREKVGSSRTLAQQALSKRKVEIAEDKFLDKRKEKRIKFKEFAQLYEKSHGLKKKSWHTTDIHYLKKLTPFFGHRYLDEITPLLVTKYQTERKQQKTYKGNIVSIAYVNRELACLKCMLTLAIGEGYLKENPVKKVKFPKENNERLRFLEKEELKRLLECAVPIVRKAIIVAVNTGMRQSEIANLKWRDVDILRGHIALNTTKNGESRKVPLNKSAATAIQSISKHPASAYIFCKKDGNPYNFRFQFQQALKKTGIKDFKFHDLRHTAASYLAMSGVDLNTIREILGHKSLDMVLRYAHLSQTHKANAVSRLDVQMDTIWSPEEKEKTEEVCETIVTPLDLVI